MILYSCHTSNAECDPLFSITGKRAMLHSCFVFCRCWGRNITIWWRTWKERSEYTAGLVHSAPRKLTGYLKSPIYYQMFIFYQPKLYRYMVSGYFYYSFDYIGVFFLCLRVTTLLLSHQMNIQLTWSRAEAQKSSNLMPFSWKIPHKKRFLKTQM